MFCEACHQMLHRARSLRKLRAEESPSHRRQFSDSSDISRASSSGSDTSKRDHSVEWDSLRLHPSMEVDRSPHITPLYQGTTQHHSHDETKYAPFAERQQNFHRPRHTHMTLSTEIHDGFDFGFAKPQAVSATGEGSQAPRRLRAPKSEADLHHRRVAGAKPAAAEWSSNSSATSSAPSPTRRAHPAGFDEADHFIKRGGWKRRGIYFGGSNDAAQESEDDCFEIP